MAYFLKGVRCDYCIRPFRNLEFSCCSWSTAAVALVWSLKRRVAVEKEEVEVVWSEADSYALPLSRLVVSRQMRERAHVFFIWMQIW